MRYEPITGTTRQIFFSWILMKIGESVTVRLGVLRKVIKGIFEEKNFSEVKVLKFFNVFQNIYKFFLYQQIFINFYCSLAVVLLNSNLLEFLK